MANQTPSTPVKVPSSAANYTPATLDADLRSQINTLLLRDGHVTKIQEHLLHSLHAHPSNWPTAIQTHALGLLRSGEVTTFPALLQRVMDDVRHDMAVAPRGEAGAQMNGSSSNTSSSGGGTVVASVDGATTTNGDSKKASSASASASGTMTNGTENGNGVVVAGAGAGADGAVQPPQPLNLALPQAVIEDALRVTRESLETVCEVDESGGAT